MARTCKRHPDREASGFCVKCGAPVCSDCEKFYNGRPYCSECMVNRLEAEAMERRAATAAAEAAKLEELEKKKITPEKVVVAIKSLPARREEIGRQMGGALPKVPKEIRRIVARVLDLAIVVFVSLPVALLIRAATYSGMREVGGMGITVSTYLAFMLVGAVYFIYLEWKFCTTAGKKLMKLKTIRYGGDGAGLTFPSSFWRWIGFLAAGCWAYGGFWVVSKTLHFVGFALKPKASLIAVTGSVILVAICSLGLLITFIGKYKRGFHDLLARSIVVDETYMERGKKSESES